MKYALAYDIGTTGVKTCLFEIDETIKLVADAIVDVLACFFVVNDRAICVHYKTDMVVIARIVNKRLYKNAGENKRKGKTNRIYT